METQENLLEEIALEDHYINATPGQRFVNYLLDLVGFYVSSFISGSLIAIPVMLIARNNPDFMTGNMIQVFLFVTGFMFPYLVYYTLFEKLSNGRTLGKLVTKTKVVRYDGKGLTFKDALLRSLIRFVPFDGISLLFNDGGAWHDDWTNTRVVKIN